MDPVRVPEREIWVAAQHWAEMLAEVQARAPLEACGILAGREGRSQHVFPVPNLDQSPVQYRMDPREQLRIFKILDQKEWDLLAIFHSHPAGPGRPSPTDVAQAYYPTAVHLIWSGETGGWRCRAYLIQNGLVRAVRLNRIP